MGIVFLMVGIVLVATMQNGEIIIVHTFLVHMLLQISMIAQMIIVIIQIQDIIMDIVTQI